MKNWMHTREFQALIERDKQHRAHVEEHWRHVHNQTAMAYAKAHPIKETFNSKGCYNPAPFRYPSFEEDPLAYISCD